MEVSFDTIRSLLTLIRSAYYMYVYSLGVTWRSLLTLLGLF